MDVEATVAYKRVRESSWSPDFPGIEECPLFPRALEILTLERSPIIEEGFFWLSVRACVARGSVRQKLVLQLCQLGEKRFPHWSGR